MKKQTTILIPETPKVKYDLTDAFPEIKEPDGRPAGECVMVQMRSPRKITRGNLIIPGSSVEEEMWNEMVGKVLRIGPCAFRNRSTLEWWPEYKDEKNRLKIGDHIAVPRYGGVRWWWDKKNKENNSDRVAIAVIKDTEIFMVIDGDPTEYAFHQNF